MATEKQILRSMIADNNKQHRKGSVNYIQPTAKSKAVAKKGGKKYRYLDGFSRVEVK